MTSLFFHPDLKQWRNRPPVIVTKVKPCLAASSRQAESSFLKEVANLPLRHLVDDQRPTATSQAIRHVRGNMLVQKQLEHCHPRLVVREAKTTARGSMRFNVSKSAESFSVVASLISSI